MSDTIRVTHVSPALTAYVAWADTHPTSVDLGDTLAAWAAAWLAREPEIERLRAEIAAVKGKTP